MRLDEYSKTRIPAKFAKTAFSQKPGKIDYYEVEEKLEKLGWIKFSEGKFSMIFSNPKKPYILKINSRPDEAYAYYVSIIRKLNNKHLPKISDLKFMEFNGEKYYIYLIEKLERAKLVIWLMV